MSKAEDAGASESGAPNADDHSQGSLGLYRGFAILLALMIVVSGAAFMFIAKNHKRDGNPHADGRIPLPASATAPQGSLNSAMRAPAQAGSGAPDVGAMVAKLEARVKAGGVGVNDIVMLARSYRVLNREKEAMDLYRKARSMAPDDPKLKLVVASALIKSSQEGARKDGQEIVDEILAQEPDKPEALWLKSIGLIERHEIIPARQTLQRLAGLVADNPAAKDAVAGLLKQLEVSPPAMSFPRGSPHAPQGSSSNAPAQKVAPKQ